LLLGWLWAQSSLWNLLVDHYPMIHTHNFCLAAYPSTGANCLVAVFPPSSACCCLDWSVVLVHGDLAAPLYGFRLIGRYAVTGQLGTRRLFAGVSSF